MAGDLRFRERAVLEGTAMAFAAEPQGALMERAIHRYGRLSVLARPEEAGEVSAPEARPMWD